MGIGGKEVTTYHNVAETIQQLRLTDEVWPVNKLESESWCEKSTI